MTVIRKFLTCASVGLAAFGCVTSAHPVSIPFYRRDAHPCPLGSEELHHQHSRRQAGAPALTDLDILQFALTLEHLEAAFYKQGFAKFAPSEFMALGLAQEQIDGLVKIGKTEASHVTALMGAIAGTGATPVSTCTYDFKFTDAKSMIATAKVLEAVGVSAYLGAAPLVTDKKILSAAASIVTIESRHQTFIRTALREDPIPQAFDVAVGARQIFTLAASFITSCPAGSALPLQAFPSLNIVNAASVKSGSTLTLADAKAFPDGTTFCSFTAGEVGTLFTPFSKGSCTVPPGLGGEVYVTITSSNTALTDDKILAGPAVLPM